MPDDVTPPAFQPDDVRKKAYAEFREELVKKQNSNSENYDKSILTVSSAGLGLSLAFIKDVVPLALVPCRTLLVQSWALFAAAIIVTILSFQTSQWSIGTSLAHAGEYYLKGKDEYLNKKNAWAFVTNILNCFSGALFVAAVLWTAYFIATNLPPPKP